MHSLWLHQFIYGGKLNLIFTRLVLAQYELLLNVLVISYCVTSLGLIGKTPETTQISSHVIIILTNLIVLLLEKCNQIVLELGNNMWRQSRKTRF